MLAWIVGVCIVWGIGFLFLFALMRMSSVQESAARREEMLLDPYSDAALLRSVAGC